MSLRRNQVARPACLVGLGPLTTRDRGLPHHVRIASPESGLDRPSWARTEDVTAASTERLTGARPLGRLTAAETDGVRRWLRRMIDL